MKKHDRVHTNVNAARWKRICSALSRDEEDESEQPQNEDGLSK